MATMTIQISDDKFERLTCLAAKRGVSVNALIEEWSTSALAEHDAKSRFNELASQGNPQRAIEILNTVESRLKGN